MFVYNGVGCVLHIIKQSHNNDIQNISGHWHHSTPFYIYFKVEHKNYIRKQQGGNVSIG